MSTTTTFTGPLPTTGARYEARLPDTPSIPCPTIAEPAMSAGPLACVEGELTWTDRGQDQYWIYRSTDGKNFGWIGRTNGETSFSDRHQPRRATYQVHYANHPRVDCETIEPRSGVRSQHSTHR